MQFQKTLLLANSSKSERVATPSTNFLESSVTKSAGVMRLYYQLQSYAPLESPLGYPDWYRE